MRKLWPGLLAIALVTVFGFMNLSRLPAELPVHWNFSGEVDGWMPKVLALSLIPAFGLALTVLEVVLPRLDPRRANFADYAGTWWLLGNAILVFFAVMQLLVLGNGLGWHFSMTRYVGIAIGSLFAVLGNYLTRVRPNWFLGIRTPWTLSSERSWRETHRLGGTLMLLGGLMIIAVAALTGTLPIWAFVTGVFVPMAISIAYSYFVWRQDTANVRHEAQDH